MHVLHSMADTEPDAPWPGTGTGKPGGRPLRPPLFSFNAMLGRAVSAVGSTREMMGATAALGKTVLRGATRMAAKPAELKRLGKTAVDLPSEAAAVLSRHLAMKTDPNTAFKGKLGVRKQVAWTAPIPLSRIKELGHAISSATLNDVLIATVTGSMRR